MRIRESQKEEIRQALLDAGLRIFAEKGFEPATVDEIAAAAGVAKGTFYNYFKTKEDMALAIGEATQLGMREAAETTLARLTTTRERLHALFNGFTAWIIANPALTWVCCMEMLRRACLAEDQADIFTELVRKAYRAGQEQGEVQPDRSAQQLALETLGICLANMSAWHHAGRTFDLAAATRAAIDTYLDGALFPDRKPNQERT